MVDSFIKSCKLKFSNIVSNNHCLKGHRVQVKKNCWEIKNCGREQGGEKVSELGVCNAAVETKFNGLNSGKNGGRICWSVAGTLCNGKVQGTFAQKRSNCLTCEIFQKVKKEERNFILRVHR